MSDVDAEEIARLWLTELEVCVRSKDYARARAIFADDVVSFGTRAAIVAGLANLEREQWRHIWETTRGFAFQYDQLHSRLLGADALLIVCPWTSQGQAANGESYERPGRATAVLERRAGRWLAAHTHFSLMPRG